MLKNSKYRKTVLIGIIVLDLISIYHVVNMIVQSKNKHECIKINLYAINGKPKNGASKQNGDLNTYEKIVKPIIDRILAFIGLILLFPICGLISIAIYTDDPGPIFFTQTRIGKNKKFFSLHKFRSMRMSAPHDVPTHLMENSDKYITRVGRVLRKTSLDELPQIWDVFCGKMSIIGPRPALWNQQDLIMERDRYGANDIFPGLTGLAQISGRDELEISYKAALDGKYTAILRKGGVTAFLQDVKCFAGTIVAVFKQDGVVEGGIKRRRRHVPE